MKPARYKATVESVSSREATVLLVDAPGCGCCAISKNCSSRAAERKVKASVARALDVRPGDRVEVTCPPGAGSRSMLWGVVVPAIVLIAVSVVMDAAGLSSSATAGYALASVGVYYLGLVIFRWSHRGSPGWKIVAIEARSAAV